MEKNACSNLTFDGSLSIADIIVKELLVEPEGIQKDYTLFTFFCPNDTSVIYRDAFNLRKPEEIVDDSLYSKVTVMGDIIGASLSNIDELLQMPYGCGEQNMLKFAPNIFIMNYLQNTNQLTDQIKNKALNYLRTGKNKYFFYYLSTNRGFVLFF